MDEEKMTFPAEQRKIKAEADFDRLITDLKLMGYNVKVAELVPITGTAGYLLGHKINVEIEL